MGKAEQLHKGQNQRFIVGILVERYAAPSISEYEANAAPIPGTMDLM